MGLPYPGKFSNFEMVDNVQGQTGLGTDRRWVELFTRTLNSSLPLINGERAADRRPPKLMGESDNVRLGIHDIEQHNMGDGDGGIITVEQDRPYPLYVMAFFGSYQVESD